MKKRLCSRKRPSTLRTEMFSLIPLTPGRIPQMRRATMSIFAPAFDAR